LQQVLLVEDHPLNRKLFRDILSFAFEVVEAESVEVARTHLGEQRPVLILMDVQLPGVDGLTFVRELKADARFAGVPIVAVSAHAMPQNAEAARRAGCVEYITKPITEDPFVFLERLKRIVAEHGDKKS
jgi:two-component system, cell cycle response regulator DivK